MKFVATGTAPFETIHSFIPTTPAANQQRLITGQDSHAAGKINYMTIIAMSTL